MRSASRIGSLCLVMVLPVLLASCATAPRPQHSPSMLPPSTDQIPRSETRFNVVKDGADGCKKSNGPYIFHARSGQTVQWHVTNECGQAVTVHIERFAVKNGSGPDPWRVAPRPTSVPSNAKGQITGVLKERAEVPGEYTGFNVYTYVVRIVAANGKVNAQDPEIIIEWN